MHFLRVLDHCHGVNQGSAPEIQKFGSSQSLALPPDLGSAVAPALGIRLQPGVDICTESFQQLANKPGKFLLFKKKNPMNDEFFNEPSTVCLAPPISFTRCQSWAYAGNPLCCAPASYGAPIETGPEARSLPISRHQIISSYSRLGGAVRLPVGRLPALPLIPSN